MFFTVIAASKYNFIPSEECINVIFSSFYIFEKHFLLIAKRLSEQEYVCRDKDADTVVTLNTLNDTLRAFTHEKCNSVLRCENNFNKHGWSFCSKADNISKILSNTYFKAASRTDQSSNSAYKTRFNAWCH